MELDDQLAALAAGELDAADARALEARVAADPALADRLARFEQLHAVLTGWEAPTLDDAAIGRLDDAVTDALAALDDAPLREVVPTRGAGLRALPPVERERETPAAAVLDGARPPAGDELGAVRDRRGVPTWVAGLGVAAALVAVVGIGVSVTGVGVSVMDTMASDDSAESLDESSSVAGDEMADDDMAADDATDTMADSAMTEESTEAPMVDSAPQDGGAADAATAQLAPRRATDVRVAAGDLLSLVGPGVADQQETTGDDDLASCVDEALTRDSDPDTERMIDLLATGTYADEDAVFVVLRAPTADGDVVTVLAYDPPTCRLLDQDTTTR